MLKTQKHLSILEDDSIDIFNNNFIDYYIARPDELNNICLADFCANYDFSKSAKIDKKEQDKSDIDTINKHSDADDHVLYDSSDQEIDTVENMLNEEKQTATKSYFYLFLVIHPKMALLIYFFYRIQTKQL
jgi:hypothetical protein